MKKLLVAIMTVLAIGLSVVPASAHTPSPYYDNVAGGGLNTWASTQVVYHFTQEVPAGIRARFRDAFQTWNQVPGAKFKFIEGVEHPTSTVDWGCDDSRLNEIHMQQVPGNNAVARTEVCQVGGRLVGFDIAFEPGVNWYTGTGTVPADKLDAWGMATHEVGHATGWVQHFIEVSTCTFNSGLHTMCSALPYGKHWFRNLEPHDIHTFQNAY